MKTMIKSNNTNSFFFSRLWHYGLLTNPTSGSENLMKVFNTMDTICSIHGEGNPIQTFTTNNTTKAFGVVGLSSGAQNTVQNGVLAYAAFLQCILQQKIDFKPHKTQKNKKKKVRLCREKLTKIK